MNALQRRPRAAFTMIEILISLTLTTVLLGAITMTLQRSSAAFRAETVAAEADAMARRAVERIAEEFMDADRSTLFFAPVAPWAANTVLYARSTGYAGGAMVVGAERQLRLEPSAGELDDGLDNDSDGLVDETRIVLDTDTGDPASAQIVLVDNVREMLEGEVGGLNGLDDNGNGITDEGGLALTYDVVTFILTIRVTVERFAPGVGAIPRTATTAIRIRND